MDEAQARERARELMQGGLHCAEAVLTAVLEQTGRPGEGIAPRAATCFGGGVGRTHEDMCGALAGGLVALGLALGRCTPQKNWDRAAAAGAGLRGRFLQTAGSTRCGTILEAFGPQEGMARCVALTAEAAGLACTVLRETLATPEVSAAQPSGCCAQAR